MTRFLNNTKTAILLGAMFALVLGISSYWGSSGLIVGLVIGVVINGFAYYFSDSLALASMGAQQVDERTAPDLVQMVRRLAERAQLPMPRVYICPHDAPNAFATGRNPANGAVAVTQGALRLLTYEELEGVMAHELAHIQNRDTLISCVAATVAGAIGFFAQIALFSGGGNRREGIHPLVALLMVILAPIAAALIQMAISRSREYVADADGARIAGSPHGLISALRKLESVSRRVPLAHESPSQNHMFIVQPLSAAGFSTLFSTHPATEQRIARLRELA